MSTKMNALADLRMMAAEEEEDEEEKPVVENPAEIKEEVMQEVEDSRDTSQESQAGNEDTPTDPSDTTLPLPPPPLKSILKKRKVPEPMQEKGSKLVKKEPYVEDASQVKPNFGGSITNALKMIKEVKPGKTVKKENNEPQPSAFIQEMEKQKELYQPPPPRPFFPYNQPVMDGIEFSDVVWGDKKDSARSESQHISEYKRLLNERVKKRKEREATAELIKEKEITSKPMRTPHNEVANCVVLITNLPFKVTTKELVLVLGVWPKDGYEGVHIMAESNGLPAGHAYVVLARHADMMDVIRMNGLEMEGRKIRVTMSTFDNLRRDLKSTKMALMTTELSRVIRVARLPFNLSKSGLLSCIGAASFAEDDIYWKPLRENQENSGRGYVVLQSSDDAKKVQENAYVSLGRTLEVRQVNPQEMKKFCDQCNLQIRENHVLNDPFPEDFVKNLDTQDFYPLPNIPKKEVKEKGSNFVVMEDLEGATVAPILSEDEEDSSDKNAVTEPENGEKKPGKNYEQNSDMDVEDASMDEGEDDSDTEESQDEANTEKKPKIKKQKSRSRSGSQRKRVDKKNNRTKLNQKLEQALKEINARPNTSHNATAAPRTQPVVTPSKTSNVPPFKPTVYVRMYNVPDKTTTIDIRNFFAPVLPAKIAQNIGYEIYDIEFYNPQDAWESMRKHLLLIRKNVITLEMLPGPPHPLPPRRSSEARGEFSDKVPNHGPMHHEMLHPMPGQMMLGPGPGPVRIHPDSGPRHMHPALGPFSIHPHMGPRPMHPDMSPRLMYPGIGPGVMHPDMGPRPMHPGMGPRPMHPHMGPRPMHSDMGPRTMHPGMGPRSMHLDMGPRPMHPDIGQRLMHPDMMGTRLIHPEMGMIPGHPDLRPHSMHPEMGPRLIPPGMVRSSMPPGPMSMTMQSRAMHPDMVPESIHHPSESRGMVPGSMPPGIGPVMIPMPTVMGHHHIPPGNGPPGMMVDPMQGPNDMPRSSHMVQNTRDSPSPVYSAPNNSKSDYHKSINPENMPLPMHRSQYREHTDSRTSKYEERKEEKHKTKEKNKAELPKERIPVPPLPTDFTNYRIPPFTADIPVGQEVITIMQGYFCQLCNKFYSSRNSAKVAHCKSKGHYDKLKQFLQEKKRLRKLAESDTGKSMY